MSYQSDNVQHAFLMQSMENLIRHLKRNQPPNNIQTEVMNNLSTEDIIKIINQLSSKGQKLRILSAQLICYLVYKNQQNIQKLQQLLGIYRNTGRIVLNSFPAILSVNSNKMKECLKILKSPIRKTQINKMCWIINPHHEKIFIQFLDEIQIYALPDLKHVIFGITYIQNSNNFLEVIQQAVKIKSTTSRKTSLQRKQLRSKSKSLNKKIKHRGYLNNGQHETSQQKNETAKSSSSIDIDIKFIKRSKIKDTHKQNNEVSKNQHSMYQTLSYTQTSSTQDHYKNNSYFQNFIQSASKRTTTDIHFKKQENKGSKNHRSYVVHTESNQLGREKIASYYDENPSKQISEMKYYKPKSYINPQPRNESERVRYRARVANETRQNNIKSSIAVKPENQLFYNNIKLREQRKKFS